MLPLNELPADLPSLRFFRDDILKKIARLEETNTLLEEKIQTDDYSEELRELYEVVVENKSTIEAMKETLTVIEGRMGVGAHEKE